jgi:uncharacterized protein YbjT (DUF2867 family)
VNVPEPRGDLVAVTGATGFVGQSVLLAAARHRIEVRALTRRKQRLRSGVEWVDGDLANPGALGRLITGTTAVIHIAGVVNAPDAAGFEAGNVMGTLNVIEAAHAAGVQRLIHVSSLAAREPELSMYGASKLRGEKLVRASGLDWSVVRPPAVFGPRDTEMLELFRLARRGIVPLPPPGRLSIIHVADLAELLLALLPSGEDVTRQMFEPDDGEPGGWTHVALAHAIGEAVREKPIRPLSLSPGMVGLAARADRLLRGKKAKLTPDRARYICHPDWTAGEGARPPRTLWRPRIETREGLHATAAWYREAGWLK